MSRYILNDRSASKGRDIRNVEGIRIAIFILLLVGIAAGIAVLTNHEGAMARYQAGIAEISGHLINLFGAKAIVQGNVIRSSGSFALSIVTACTGLFMTGVFVVAVLAFPAGILAKLIGMLLGAGAIFLMNIARLVSLFYVGIRFPNMFEEMHLLVWQSLIIVLSLFLWLLWARKVTHEH